MDRLPQSKVFHGHCLSHKFFLATALQCSGIMVILFIPGYPVYPHFDAICDLLPNRCTATWNLFVKYLCIKIVQDFVQKLF